MNDNMLPEGGAEARGGGDMDAAELHRRAVERFGELVRMLGDDQWQVPSPNPGWDVRDLVNHLVVENRWTKPLIAGMTIEEVGRRFEGDLLGDDPGRAWEEAARPERRSRQWGRKER